MLSLTWFDGYVDVELFLCTLASFNPYMSACQSMGVIVKIEKSQLITGF